MSAGMRIKHVLIRILPGGWRRALRRWNAIRQVRSYRAAQWEWTPVVRALIPVGGHVIDAGANIGYLTRLFSEWVGADGRVLSIEPMPDTCAILRETIERFAAASAETVQCALSDTEGEGVMAPGRYADGAPNYYESALVAGTPPPDAESVPIRTLDALVAERALSPGLIKIDVEGHEAHVLKGAEHTLHTYTPHLLVELNNDPSSTDNESGRAMEWLKGKGYEPFVRSAWGLAFWAPGHPSVDFLFAHRSRAVELYDLLDEPSVRQKKNGAA